MLSDILVHQATSSIFVKYACNKGLVRNSFDHRAFLNCFEIPAGTETCQIGPLDPGIYFWVLTAFNESQQESGYSNEVSAAIE